MTGVDYRSIPGWWNARVAAGATVEERRALLEECPEEFRAGVESHVRTVYALRRIAPRRKVRAMETTAA